MPSELHTSKFSMTMIGAYCNAVSNGMCTSNYYFYAPPPFAQQIVKSVTYFTRTLYIICIIFTINCL